MPVNLDDLMSRGGKGLMDLLAYSVYSVRPEALFIYLVREYRLAPTVKKALALYDGFCAPSALARLAAEAVLEPYDLRLHRSLTPMRQVTPVIAMEVTPLESDESTQQQRPPRLPAQSRPPGLHVFDFVVEHLLAQPDGPISVMAQTYDPDLSPIENLPGGKLTPAQRQFVDRIWLPRLRPLLVQVGFWRLSTVGA